MGITIYGTDVHGTVRVITDGESYRVETERGGTVTGHQSTGDPAAPEPDPAADPPATAGCVDINTASLGELQRINHIGPDRAQQIITLRPFASVQGLSRVAGIGPARLADIVEEGLACVR